MAVQLLAYEVADLCLGKPPLRSLSASATVYDALAALKSSDDNFISIWSCDHYSSQRKNVECSCVGKVCMVDIICYLCREDNFISPSLALKSSVSVLLPEVEGLVRHVEPSSSILEAIDLILEGAQNLVVPIKSNSKNELIMSSSSISEVNHNGQEFCWLTQEDLVRFFLSSIGLFSTISTLSIATLRVISHEYVAVNYHSPASSAINAISSSLSDQTSVLVVDYIGSLIGEISPITLACCDETVVAAIMTLSAGDLMAYIDCHGPPDEIVRLVEERFKEKELHNGNSSSSDDELSSPTTPLRSRWYSRCASYSAWRRAAEAIVCYPGSSLVAVMIQAIAHRVNYVWVIEDDCSAMVGIVTFANILKVFRENFLSCDPRVSDAAVR